MLEFYEKRKLSQLFFSKGTVFVMCIMVILMACATINAYYHKQEAGERRIEAANALHRLEARVVSISEDIAELEDPRGVESELRRRYNAGKYGEQVVIFVEPEEVSTAPELTPQSKTWWEGFVARAFGE